MLLPYGLFEHSSTFLVGKPVTERRNNPNLCQFASRGGGGGVFFQLYSLFLFFCFLFFFFFGGGGIFTLCSLVEGFQSIYGLYCHTCKSSFSAGSASNGVVTILQGGTCTGVCTVGTPRTRLAGYKGTK